MKEQILNEDWLYHEYENEIIPILNLFLDESNESIHLLQQALEKEDFEMIKFYAHKLRGTALIIGAELMAKSAQLIEETEDINDFKDQISTDPEEITKSFSQIALQD